MVSNLPLFIRLCSDEKDNFETAFNSTREEENIADEEEFRMTPGPSKATVGRRFSAMKDAFLDDLLGKKK